MVQAMSYFWHVNHVDFYLRGAMKCEKRCIFLKIMEKQKDHQINNETTIECLPSPSSWEKFEPELIHYN